MSVRITGGHAKGRVLREPVTEGVRPTSARVREALFSLVGQDLSGQRVLDAFGGAGLIGIEAWSRGADVVVVEKDRKALRALQKRGAEVAASWSVESGDVLALADRMGHFDGVFVDPPYEMDAGAVLARLAPIATSWLVYESGNRAELPDRAGALVLDRRREYGHSALWVYRSPDELADADEADEATDEPVDDDATA